LATVSAKHADWLSNDYNSKTQRSDWPA